MQVQILPTNHPYPLLILLKPFTEKVTKATTPFSPATSISKNPANPAVSFSILNCRNHSMKVHAMIPAERKSQSEDSVGG